MADPDAPARVVRSSRGALWFAVLVAVGLALLAYAASAGSVSFGTSRPVAAPTFTPPTRTATIPTQPAQSALKAPGADSLPQLPDALVFALRALVTLVAVAVLVLAVRWIWRRIPRLARQDNDLGAGELPPDLGERLLHGARRRADLLEVGSPGNAVIAAWLDLQTSLDQAGLRRDAAETPTEYVLRALQAYGQQRPAEPESGERAARLDGSAPPGSVSPGMVSPGMVSPGPVSPELASPELVSPAVPAAALGELAVLYREARFSGHELTEAHRDRARRALDVVHTSLRAALDATASTTGGRS